MPDTRLRPGRRERTSDDSESLRLSSPSLLDGNPIPQRHSAGGGNASPALSWSALPEETASIAVTCEDPEGPAGPFTLWILFNVPAGLSGIPEGVSKVPLPPEIPGAEQGINDTGNTGYDGPAPPRGHPAHRYVFRVLALDALLALPPGVTRATFEASAGGHVLAQGRIVGTFSR